MFFGDTSGVVVGAARQFQPPAECGQVSFTNRELYRFEKYEELRPLKKKMVSIFSET